MTPAPLTPRPEEPDWGRPPWRIDLPSCREAPPPRRCDAAVVGGGLAGLAAARLLAVEGARVALLEAGRLGRGASGRSGGLALEGTHQGSLPGLDGCLALLRARTEELGIDCGLRLPGCRELVHRAPGEGAETGAAGDGAPAWWDGDTVLVERDREPGGVLDPGRLLSGLGRAALAAGASLHEGVAVRSVAPPRSGNGAILEAERGPVRAGAVLVATNAWLPELVPGLAPPPVSALTLALATEPLGRDARAALVGAARHRILPFYTADLPYLWGRELEDGGLVVGSGLWLEAPGALIRRRLADPPIRALLERLRGRVRGLHPTLSEIGIRARWGGPVALLRGRPPYLGWHPRLPRTLVAGGWSGHGAAAGLAAGEWAARAVLRSEPLPAWGRVGRPEAEPPQAAEPASPEANGSSPSGRADPTGP